MRALALLAALLAAAPAAAQEVQDALQAGELICEFRDGFRRSLIADLTSRAPRTDLLLVYEAVREGTAQAISSRAPGRRPVRVRATAKGVHFIQPAGASVMVTTLTKCERTKWKNGVETCVRFSARHAWHFDTLAHVDPDKSFERQPTGASTGACEPWNVD